MANLGDGPAVAIGWRHQKIYEAIKRGGIMLPAGFKHAIRKEIKISRKTQRNFHGRIFGIRKTTNRRPTRWQRRVRASYGTNNRGRMAAASITQRAICDVRN